MLSKKLALTIMGAFMFSPVLLPPNDFIPVAVVRAETYTVEADGYYTMGDGIEENQAIAKERARADAKRAASEKACNFIESISEVQQSKLIRDEIKSFSAAVLKIVSESVKIETNGDSLIFHCHITAIVDTDDVNDKLQYDRYELDKLLRQTKEQAELIDKLTAEINDLKVKYVTATEDERQIINAEIKHNEEQFTAAQWYEKGLEYDRLETVHLHLDNRGNMHYDDEYIELCNKAIDCFNKAIEINPNYADAWRGLADSCISRWYLPPDYDLDDYQDKIIGHFREMSNKYPENYAFWGAFGLVYNYFIDEFYSDHDFDTEKVALENLLAYCNKTAEYLNKAIKLNIGDVKTKANDYYELSNVYDRISTYYECVDNHDKEIYYTRKALECELKAIELNPEEYYWLEKYIDDYYSRLNNPVKAQESYEEYRGPKVIINSPY